MFPLAAITPRSDARQLERGPVNPNGVTLTHTESGATDGSTVHAPAKPGVSITMSAVPSSSANAGSSGPETTTDCLPALHASHRSGRARRG
jgi:hypothetical protein